MEILAMVKVSVVWRLWLWRLAIKSTRLFFTFRMHPVRKKNVEVMVQPISQPIRTLDSTGEKKHKKEARATT
jgi:hypothetical protein|tara:strand:+ start:1106 stop:1321 length:216 start_codon:yes stop_codon:yes gene_type:complete